MEIIYIDDEADICELFADLFQNEKVKIHTFTNPEHALSEMGKLNIDLAFIDFRLPHTTGDLVALQMDPKIPKVLITGDLSVQSQFKFDRIFNKPICISEIEKFIEAHSK